ncbi:MAG: HlyD family secretion protein [Burkholderiales bacterium]
MKRTAIAALAVVAAAAGAYVFLRQDRPPPAPPPAAVHAQVAAEGRVTAMPGFDVHVGTGELNGKIERILVREGDRVEQGEVIAILQNEDLKARVRQAERELAVAQARLREVRAGARQEEILAAAAALEGATAAMEEAQRLLERYRGLREQGMVSQAAFDEKERIFRAARAAVKEAEQRKKLLESGPRPETVRLYEDQVSLARAQLEYSHKLLEKTFIRAPIAGTVIERFLDEGEGITPEIPIVALVDLGRTWINAEVDETDSGRIGVGDVAEVTSDAFRGRIFKGRVVQIAQYAGVRKIVPGNPAVNLGLKVVQVKIVLDEAAPLRLGMTVYVKIAPRRD